MANEMRSKDKIVEELGVVILEGKSLDVQMYILEVLLDVRELLVEIRDRTKDITIDFVAPDYGKENE